MFHMTIEYEMGNPIIKTYNISYPYSLYRRSDENIILSMTKYKGTNIKGSYTLYFGKRINVTPLQNDKYPESAGGKITKAVKIKPYDGKDQKIQQYLYVSRYPFIFIEDGVKFIRPTFKDRLLLPHMLINSIDFMQMDYYFEMQYENEEYKTSNEKIELVFQLRIERN